MKREQETFPYIAHLLNGAEVEWKPLGEVAKIEKGKRVTKQQLSSDKEYPVYSGGVKPMGYYDEYNQEADTITIVKYGTAGYVNFITEKFWANDVCYCIKPKADLDNKFLLHVLKNMQEYISSLATDAIPAHLPSPSLEAIQIPVPPLSVQQEIVRILDKFTQLEAELKIELETELDCRKRQYEYYRDKLLSFNEVVGGAKTLIFSDLQWKTLGEVAKVNKGVQLNKTKLKDEGKYPAYNGGKTYSGWTDDFNVEENTTIISQGGASAGFVNFVTTKFWANAHCYYVIPNLEIVNNRYLYQFLKFQEKFFMNSQHGAGIPALAISKLNKHLIPLPPIEEQERIAGILDKFDTLVNSISEGLPREIELRRKQYEYYREKLLSFPKN